MVASFVVASLLQWRTDTFLLSEGETQRPVEINRAKIPLLSCPERLQSRLDSIETGVKPRSLKFSRTRVADRISRECEFTFKLCCTRTQLLTELIS